MWLADLTDLGGANPRSGIRVHNFEHKIEQIICTRDSIVVVTQWQVHKVDSIRNLEKLSVSNLIGQFEIRNFKIRQAKVTAHSGLAYLLLTSNRSSLVVKIHHRSEFPKPLSEAVFTGLFDALEVCPKDPDRVYLISSNEVYSARLVAASKRREASKRNIRRATSIELTMVQANPRSMNKGDIDMKLVYSNSKHAVRAFRPCASGSEFYVSEGPVIKKNSLLTKTVLQKFEGHSGNVLEIVFSAKSRVMIRYD